MKRIQIRTLPWVCQSVATLVLLGALTQAVSAAVVFSNSSAVFNAAMAAATNPYLGTEDFEGSSLTAPSNQNINDPLTQSVPNGAYSSGLTQPMTVQTNTLGASPATPSPGSIMLLVPAGSRNAISDVVVPASSAVSFDWIFHDPRIRGVGLNPIILHDGGTAEVKVYNQDNVLLGSFTTPADAIGSNFLGIQAIGTDRISRVNFRGLSGFGRAAGDNAALFIPEPSNLVLLAIGIATTAFLRCFVGNGGSRQNLAA
jgi:hypothetical protein